MTCSQKMPSYIGTKIICAVPMTAGRFAETHKDKSLPTNNVDDKGYLVEYSDGYKSWSPKITFESNYRLISPGEKRLV